MGSLLPARLAKKLTLLLVDDPSQQQSQRPLRFLLLRGLATITPTADKYGQSPILCSKEQGTLTMATASWDC